MLSKKRNCRQDHIKLILVIIIISFILFPLVIGCLRSSSNIKFNDSLPKLNVFSNDDYSAILTEEKHGLGNITVNDINFNDLEPGFLIYNDTYPLIWADYNAENLNATQFNMKFVNTTKPAIVDNLNEKIIDNNVITVRLNESVFVEYNNLTEGNFIYHARLAPCDLSQLFVNNGTKILELDAETHYNVDVDKFIVFDYKSYFPERPNSNFTIYFIWEYTLDINEWSLNQNSENNLMIVNNEQNFTVDFNYHFVLFGQKYNISVPIPVEPIVADNIYISLTVNLPDKNLLSDHSLELNNEIVTIANHLNPDNTIDVLLADLFSGFLSEFSLNFTTVFTFKFIDSIGKTWTIDRLVELNNIRERIYYASLIGGPQHIFLKYISFYEPAIYSDQILRNYSLFERDIAYFHLNTSLTGRQGIKVRIPYLMVGETCPFIIKYIPTQTLRVVVSDSIKMPLIGANIKIFYFNKEYGTYISKDRSQPMTPGKSNENGEVALQNVPRGNYTISIYYNGRFLKESICSTDNYRNYINTNYPHFPIWIIIFGVISGIILIFGVVFYRKYKKAR